MILFIQLFEVAVLFSQRVCLFLLIRQLRLQRVHLYILLYASVAHFLQFDSVGGYHSIGFLKLCGVNLLELLLQNFYLLKQCLVIRDYGLKLTCQRLYLLRLLLDVGAVLGRDSLLLLCQGPQLVLQQLRCLAHLHHISSVVA